MVEGWLPKPCGGAELRQPLASRLPTTPASSNDVHASWAEGEETQSIRGSQWSKAGCRTARQGGARRQVSRWVVALRQSSGTHTALNEALVGILAVTEEQGSVSDEPVDDRTRRGCVSRPDQVDPAHEHPRTSPQSRLTIGLAMAAVAAAARRTMENFMTVEGKDEGKVLGSDQGSRDATRGDCGLASTKRDAVDGGDRRERGAAKTRESRRM